MKTVLIIGAGATRAVAGNKSRKYLPPLDSDFFEIARKSSLNDAKRVTSALEKFVGEYHNTICSSLETTTTYLYLKALDASKNDAAHKAFLDLQYLLGNVLSKNTNDLPVGPASLLYRLLLSESKRENGDNAISIITFNYDLLLERVLSEMQAHNKISFTFPGCYRLDGLRQSNVVPFEDANDFGDTNLTHAGVPILKLHGSLNWHSKHKSDRPNPSALTNPNRELFVANGKELWPEVSWKQQRRTIYMKPIIVPPVSGKRGIMHKSILPLWKKAASALSEADRVIIIGYSCPAMDLEARILLSENLRKNKNPAISVIDPCSKTAARFSVICGVTKLTIYDSIKSWINSCDKHT